MVKNKKKISTIFFLVFFAIIGSLFLSNTLIKKFFVHKTYNKYLYAADFNKDGNYSLSDIMTLARSVYGG